MYQFVSWIEKDKDVFFLTNDDLKPKKLKEFKEYNIAWQCDLRGHGAIRWFYPLLEQVGVERECENFSTPDNFPDIIVESIKNMKMTKIGIGLDLLNDKGRKKFCNPIQPAEAKYEEIRQLAYAEYEKIRQSAWTEYLKIKRPVYAEYLKIERRAYAEYEEIDRPAGAECEKIRHFAYAEYKKIEQPAWAKYLKIKQPARVKYEESRQLAWEEYQKIEQEKFWETFENKKYRNKKWL